MPDWPHQARGVAEVARLVDAGESRIALTSPTGGGKSRMMLRLVEWGLPTVIYANRKMLIEQLSAGMTEAGVQHGMQASGYEQTIFHNVQVASIQTVEKRWAAGEMHLHPAELVIVDEIHNEKGDRLQAVLNEHVNRGAVVVGFTATPVGIGGLVDRLVVAGVTSELRRCGSLLPAQTYAPDEPSMKAFKPRTKGLLQFRDEVKEVMLPAVFGSVVTHYRRLNPGQRPAILFAPGVAESLWFAQHLCESGIPAAHIDAQKIWINGESKPSNTDTRQELRAASESGEVKVVCNRFVLREGVDWPHLYHGIFACTFGGLCSYLQAGGRILRNHDSMDHVIIQDHGGNFWRHDSLNVDREWELDKPESQYAAERAEKLRKHNETDGAEGEPEPIVCPKCFKSRAKGVTCPQCGHTCTGKSRRVIEVDGSLLEVKGDIFRPRKQSKDPAEVKDWKAVYFRCLKSGKTFAQARGLFQHEHGGLCPNRDWPFMPTREADWHRKVKDVPRNRLIQEQQQPNGYQENQRTLAL